MTGIFYPLVSCLLLPRLVSIPFPHIYDHRNSAKVYSTQPMESAIDPRNGEDGPLTNQVAHRTPFIPFYPMVSHIGLREYTSPAPMRHHNPFPLFH